MHFNLREIKSSEISKTSYLPFLGWLLLDNYGLRSQCRLLKKILPKEIKGAKSQNILSYLLHPLRGNSLILNVKVHKAYVSDIDYSIISSCSSNQCISKFQKAIITSAIIRYLPINLVSHSGSTPPSITFRLL